MAIRPNHDMTSNRCEALIRRLAGILYETRAIRFASWIAGYSARRRGCPILIYHRVNDEGDDFLPATPTADFERQMAYVASSYRVMPLDEMVERAQADDLPRNSLAITFDDGYRDNLTHAAPILHRYRLPSTIFLATGFIGTGAIPWFDRLAIALKLARAEAVEAPWGETMALHDRAARLTAFERVQRHLKTLGDDELQRALDVLLERLDVPNGATLKNLMLDWADVRALAGLGFGVGGHTVRHVILSRVTSERSWAEIRGSRTAIEAGLGSTPTGFAYPNGRSPDYSPATIELVRKAGFAWAVTTRLGLNTAQTPPYELRRRGPWEPDVATFALKLAVYRVVHGRETIDDRSEDSRIRAP
jgi:peptidoglycan/xylan/chitin deacetylase (PgdA/CDA1 family)